MNVNRSGKYRLIEDKTFRTYIECFTVEKGSIINVTQIDLEFTKFYSDDLKGWHYWEQPFEPVD